MRVIVLLCLLHAAVAQSVNFSWFPGSSESHEGHYEQSEVCLTDQASCGCCLMQTHMERMEWYLSKSLEALKKELTHAKMTLNNIRASRSAFSVALNSQTCFGSSSTNETIIYKNVSLNLGEGYNNETGIFTAPRCGVYSLALSIYSGEVSHSCANLVVNNTVAASVIESKNKDFEDSATVVVSVKLNAGDTVKVVVPKNCSVCSQKHYLNTFTGFLLFATDEYKMYE